MARHTADNGRTTNETTEVRSGAYGTDRTTDTTVGRGEERPTWTEGRDHAVADTHGRHAVEVAPEDGTAEAHSRFGGTNWGSAFFGWLVAIAITILLTGIVGAIATAVGASNDLSQTDAERQAGSIGIAAAIAVVVILAIGYYAGGYVSGRMSRFDGGRQGFGVWLIGLIVTLLAVAAGAIFGSQYNVLDRVNLPRLPIPDSAATVGGIITALVILVVTLLAAMLGGKVGHRYHNRVDRVVRGYR